MFEKNRCYFVIQGIYRDNIFSICVFEIFNRLIKANSYEIHVHDKKEKSSLVL